MKLKKKFYIFHLFIAGVILLSVYFFYNVYFRIAVKDLQKERAVILSDGVRSLIEKETTRISRVTDDSAAWDTMYEFAVNPSEALASDISPDNFVKYMNLSLFAVIDNDLEIVFMTGYDRMKDKRIAFDDLREKRGKLWTFLLESLNSDEAFHHLLKTDYGVMILVSSPIIRSDETGTPRGRLFLGHIIDEKFGSEISEILGENVRFRSKDYKPETGELILAWNNYRVYDGKSDIRILCDMSDTHENYAFTIEIIAKENFTAVLKKLISMFTVALLIIFLIAGIIIYSFFNRSVLKRIEYVSEKTTRIVTSNDLSIVFPVNSDDEICRLKKNLNNMLKRMREEIRKTWEAQNMLMLNEKMIFLGNITASMAHEVINPLFAVSNAVEYIRKSGIRQNKGIEEAFSIIEKETARVREIAMNLNRYSIQESISFSPADLKDIIDAAITVANWSRDLKHIEFDIIKKTDRLPIYCNPGAIQQVFINLIVNSIDAMEGKGRMTIRITADEKDYKIDFLDEGPGFSEAIIDRAFDSFKTTKTGSGAGLGLYISHNIIKDHLGTIGINGNYKRGAHSIIIIPKKGVIK